MPGDSSSCPTCAPSISSISAPTRQTPADGDGDSDLKPVLGRIVAIAGKTVKLVGMDGHAVNLNGVADGKNPGVLCR